VCARPGAKVRAGPAGTPKESCCDVRFLPITEEHVWPLAMHSSNKLNCLVIVENLAGGLISWLSVRLHSFLDNSNGHGLPFRGFLGCCNGLQSYEPCLDAGLCEANTASAVLAAFWLQLVGSFGGNYEISAFDRGGSLR
jgi:hypothetical protein